LAFLPELSRPFCEPFLFLRLDGRWLMTVLKDSVNLLAVCLSGARIQASVLGGPGRERLLDQSMDD